METVGVFFKALVLGTVTEAVLEYVFGIWWTPFPEELRPKILMAIGLVFGIAVCVYYQIDLLAELGLRAGIVGNIISGALVGRGADYLHKFWDKLAE